MENLKKVDEALKIIEKAVTDKDFQAWLEANKDSLDYEYDSYAGQCYESLEEPDSFSVWALGRYVSEKLGTVS